MNNFTMRSEDAWREIYAKLMGELPVDATFNMVNVRCANMVVRVDGRPMDMYLVINKDGTWTATYCPNGVPEHMK